MSKHLVDMVLVIRNSARVGWDADKYTLAKDELPEIPIAYAFGRTPLRLPHYRPSAT